MIKLFSYHKYSEILLIQALIHGIRVICVWGFIGLNFTLNCHAQTIKISVSNIKNFNNNISHNSLHGFNSNFFRSPENIDNPILWKFFEDLQMPLLRFPGGLADWYNWQNGMIETSGRVTLDFMNQGGFKNIPIDDIISIIRKYKIKLIYVINIYDSEEKIKDLFITLLLSGIDICGIEIGNELYTKSLSDELGGPTEYLIKARIVLKVLRECGYNGPIGINLASSWWNPGQENHVHREHWREWNLILQEDGLADFEAVIQHFYPFVGKIGFREAVDEAPAKFKKMVEDIRNRFPGKQVWITEWNLGQPVNISEFNSLYHAIFNMRMFAMFLETGVDITCYHIISGRGWELIGPDRFFLNYLNSQEIKIIRRVPYFAFKLFGEAYKIANGYKIGKIKDIEYIILASDKKLSIICWTIKTVNYNLQLESSEKIIFANGEGLQCDNLFSSNGNLTRWKEEKKILPWKENCIIKSTDYHVFKGPGIFKFEYNLSQ